MAPVALHDIDGFRHEAVFYDGVDEFIPLAIEFIHAGVEADELVLVATAERKIEALRAALGTMSERVEFADMEVLGANPARIIPRWQAFADEGRRRRRRIRGIGEPVWAERSAIELAECHRHEALLNLAFDGSDPFLLVCPYDTSTLAPEVLAAARTTHPVTTRNGVPRPADQHMTFDLGGPLPPLPGRHLDVEFDATRLHEVRELVGRAATASRLGPERVTDLVLATDEVAANSVLHGGGRGTLRIWHEPDRVVVEITDHGHITDPLVGRVAPAAEAVTGRGLWIVNQVCDLVQLRSDPTRTTVRLHMRIDAAGGGHPALAPG
jgi:anti-sigma regulatory factor (Ser/Thr protein kinase)